VHRFYLPPNECTGPILHLAGSEAHHAIHVLRLGRGDRVTVLDGAGTELLCDVESQQRNNLGLKVIEKRAHPPLPCRVTLLQALPKGKLIESIIQKATELGAAHIIPLLTERVVVRLDQKEAQRKSEKWQQIAIEALKQCGSPWLPKIEAPVTPQQFLERGESFELPLVASLQNGSKHPREFLRTFSAEHNRAPKSACIWIGPEGDFTPDENSLIQSSGALPITLGRLVLRTETAAIFCLSVLNYEYNI
jgi:16S rRNA (uracil1498-N3)-methyltransferase